MGFKKNPLLQELQKVGIFVQVRQLELQDMQVDVAIIKYVESGHVEMHLFWYNTPVTQVRQSNYDEHVLQG